MSPPLLEADRLVAGYGAHTVLQGVSVMLEEGELVSMVGLNGAGKSVALRCLAGLLRPWAGRVSFSGRDVTDLTPEERAALGVRMVPQGRGIFPAFTVEQNLRIGGYRLRSREFAERLSFVYERYPRLFERRTQRAGTLSGGEQAMLALGRALVDLPRLLLLDEPTAGLAPLAAAEMAELVAELHRDGMTILLVEQSIGVALRLASRVLLMQKGTIIREASPTSLRDRRALLDELGAGGLYARERDGAARRREASGRKGRGKGAASPRAGRAEGRRTAVRPQVRRRGSAR